VGIAHLDDAPFHEHELGHLRSRWTMVGDAAGCEKVGVRRIQVPVGGWSTPAHEHGREEEIFYVLSGRGVSWQAGEAAGVRAGTGVAHVFRAGAGGLTYLAYGMRDPADVCYYPRSNKIAMRGIGLVARLERLDYWDGED
jgi:uncharacterized cupin superfamily protein